MDEIKNQHRLKSKLGTAKERVSDLEDSGKELDGKWKVKFRHGGGMRRCSGEVPEEGILKEWVREEMITFEERIAVNIPKSLNSINPSPDF